MIATRKLSLLFIGTAGLSAAVAVYAVPRLTIDSHRAKMVKRGVSSVAAGPTSPRLPALHITAIIQHGHIVEIKGTADSGATVMINGQPATTVFDGNEFRHFLGPLPTGTSVVSVTAQDEQGGVNTKQLAITLE